MIAIDIRGSHITSIEIEDILKGKTANSLRQSHVPIKGRSKDELLDDYHENL